MRLAQGNMADHDFHDVGKRIDNLFQLEAKHCQTIPEFLRAAFVWSEFPQP